MNTVGTVLVVPTIRENCLRDFIARWNAIGLFKECDLIVMEDNPTKTFDLSSVFPKDNPFADKALVRGDGLVHYCWEDIERTLGADSWIIPRRSDTVRSFGYYMAWKMGYKYIVTLDDDCYPPTANADGLQYDGVNFLRAHRHNLEGRSRWFNTLNAVKPRGIPFYNLGKNDKIVLSHGLWTNVLDYDAPTQLVKPVPEKFSFDTQIVPANSYFPMCGMNVMWRGEITVLMYHLLMGQRIHRESTKVMDEIGLQVSPSQVTSKLPFDRFGDIWCGILMKKIVDAKGLNVTSGMPYIRHERASNVWANLRKESAGLEVNEKFWERVDEFLYGGDEMDSFADFYQAMGVHVSDFKAFPEHLSYFQTLGRAMQIWAGLFMEKA